MSVIVVSDEAGFLRLVTALIHVPCHEIQFRVYALEPVRQLLEGDRTITLSTNQHDFIPPANRLPEICHINRGDIKGDPANDGATMPLDENHTFVEQRSGITLSKTDRY